MKIEKVTKRERRFKREYKRDYYKKPRLYFHPVGETVLQNLYARTSRPYNEYRKLLPEVFAQLGLPEGTTAKWSKHAGCAMCPCSPGFIVTIPGDPLAFWDAWVDVSGWVHEVPAERVAAVNAAIEGDPTLAILSN